MAHPAISSPSSAAASKALAAPTARSRPSEMGAARPGVPPASDFSSVFRTLGDEMDRGEAAMHAITRAGSGGTSLSTTDLLVLQSRIYRYSEAIDLAAKLVDRGTNGVRTLLTSQ